MAKQYADTLRLKERNKGSEKTRPQIYTSTLFSSRMRKTYEITNQNRLITPELIREIRRDPTVHFCRQVVVAPAVHTPWTVKAKPEAPEGAKELIEKCFLQSQLWLLQGSLLGSMDYGWMPYESVLQLNKETGQIEIVEFKQLLQEFTDILVYIDTGQFAGVVNRIFNVSGNVELFEIILRENNSFITNLEVEGTNWYGRSLAEMLDQPVNSWNSLEQTAERYDRKVAGATWAVYYPVGQSDYNGTKMRNDLIAQDILSTLEASGGVAIPSEIQEWLDDSIDKEYKGKWEIELITASGSSSEKSFNDRARYLDYLKARVFGLPERSVLEGKFGTKAESEVHSDVGLSTIDTKHRFTVMWYNKYPVNTLLTLNWGKKYRGTVWIEVAPLADAQFQTIKEIYRLLIQNPSSQMLEFPAIDTDALREELAIPSIPEAEREEFQIPQVNDPRFSQQQQSDGNGNGQKQNQNNNQDEE